MTGPQFTARALESARFVRLTVCGAVIAGAMIFAGSARAAETAAPAATTTSAVGTHGGWDADPQSWRAWATTSVIVLAIWAATSLANWELHYFWPIWVIGPWGAVLLARTLTGRPGPDGHRRC